MEKKFLVYLLYITLVELREHSYQNNDKKTFWLCDLLHNVPASLESDESSKEEYEILCANAASMGLEGWLAKRKAEFDLRNVG